MSKIKYSKTIPTEIGQYWMILGRVQSIVEVFKDSATGELYIEDNSNSFKPTIYFIQNMNVQWSQKL